MSGDRSGPQNWRELFPSCPHVAENIFAYLDVANAVACRQVYPEWVAVVDACRPLIERTKRLSFWKAAREAARTGEWSLLEFLAENGADVNQRNRGGGSALMYTVRALSMGRFDVARMLIAKGANVNAADEDGMTALMMAVKKSDVNMTQLLIEHGARINASNKGGITPLMMAVWGHSALRMAELLIAHGADVNATSKFGNTPLSMCHCAMESAAWDNPRDKEKADVQQLLLAKGARRGRLN